MTTRRNFIRLSAFSAALLSVSKSFGKRNYEPGNAAAPIILSTWKWGLEANEEAWKIISRGGRALDAVEAGVRLTEGDLGNVSVGLGGNPDRDGHVTLDACIMDEKGNCGSVCFVEGIRYPTSLARAVMEKTPHIILVGEGAVQFAKENGFTQENNGLTPRANTAWKKWLKKSKYKPEVNPDSHDTIGMIAIDASGNLSGACTTSGLPFKMHGRVGDSPIIGAGLFVDNEVGAATATGNGEEVIRTCGSHTIVEMMRQGHSPEEACRIAIERISKSPKDIRQLQVGYLAVNKHGEFGAYSLQKGFNYAMNDDKGNRLLDSDFMFK